MLNGLGMKGEIEMLTRRYVERRIEKRGYWNPTNGRLYVEGEGLLQSNHLGLAEATDAGFAYRCDVLYLMPSLGRWKDSRGRYPGKADWEVSGVQLANYYRNHSATVALGELDMDIIPIGVWFPSVDESTYMSDVIKAMAFLKDLLTKHFQPIEAAKGKHDEYRVELLSTPARTGMDLLRRKLPYGIKYPDLPEDVERIVMTQFGQARTELFDHGRELVEDLHNYDGMWMYASCCRDMPVGRCVHDTENLYKKYVTGLYYVTACVPHDWHHIGLLPVREGDKTIWPNMPGFTFRSWCSHRDLALAYEYGWDIQFIHERILWSDTQARGVKIGQDPLQCWMKTLVLLRETISLQYEEPICSMLRDAFRSLLNMTIGRLHMAGRTVDVYTADFSEDPGEGTHLAEEYADGSFRYEKQQDLNAYQKEGFKPHWALEVWNQAKWKVTKAALEIPYDQLISIRTDGLWTTCKADFPDTGKPGCFREKNLVERGPFAWPSNDLEFVHMIQRARHG
jgi:DNA polymerase type B, organellar and viral